MSYEFKSDSYMEMALHVDGEASRVLRIPTLWDSVESQWIGVLQLPKSLKLISETGKDSFELQNNFTRTISLYFKDPRYHDELMGLFKPIIEWD